MKPLALALMAAIAGAGAMYLFDPMAGPRRRERLRARFSMRRDQEIDEDDGLAPLSMLPEPLERVQEHRFRVLPALAMATPVAVAVGAVLWRRGEHADWLH